MLRIVQKCGYSTAMKSSVGYSRKGEQPLIAPLTLQTTSNDIVSITTIDNHGPSSHLAIYVKAGSRYDSPLKPGISHLSMKTLFRNLPSNLFLRTILDSELRGNKLYSNVSREHISIGSTFLRDDLVDVVPCLIENLVNPDFEVYEFLEGVENCAQDSSKYYSMAENIVKDKLHQVAFRNGLGNYLYASNESLDQLVRKDVLDFLGPKLSKSSISIVGWGVNHNDLKTLVAKSIGNLEFSESSSDKLSSKYYGGEARIEAGPASSAIYAVAFPGVSYSGNNYGAALVLKALLGGMKKYQYGKSSGLLGKASSALFQCESFNYSYEDAGILGFTIMGEDQQEFIKYARSAMECLKSATSITDQSFQAAQKAAIIDYQEEIANSKSLSMGEYAPQSILRNSDFIQSVEKSNVEKIAKTALAGKKSVVAYGNLLVLPYSEDL